MLIRNAARVFASMVLCSWCRRFTVETRTVKMIRDGFPGPLCGRCYALEMKTRGWYNEDGGEG